MLLASILPQSLADLIPLDLVALKYLHYAAAFGIFGALGFWFLVLRRVNARFEPASPDPSLSGVFTMAERGAASAGVIGALLLFANLIGTVSRNSHMGHVTVAAAVAKLGTQFYIQMSCAALLLIAFSFAVRRSPLAWGAAAVVATALGFRKLVLLQWEPLVNPLHEVAAALWLGTLFVLVTAGLPAILLGAPRERRGALVAELVARFSPLALAAAILLGVTGVIAAWVNLKHVSALWTTPYGYALDAKLCVVAVVAALGAWNWRRMTPKLGTEDAAHTLRRSSTWELSFAGVVLFLTAILVIMPAPKP